MLKLNLLASIGGEIAIGGAVGIIVGIAVGYMLCTYIIKNKNDKARVTSAKIIENALQEAKTLKKEAILEQKEEIQKMKNEADQDIRERRFEVQKLEDRLILKEENLLKKEEQISNKQDSVDALKLKIEEKEKLVDKKIEELEEQKLSAVKELERVANLTRENAKKELIASIEEEAKVDCAKTIRQLEEKAKDEASKKAKEIVTLAVQKCAVDHSSEICVSTVELPSEEMKGRIIGREGRNIRALEQATGVDLIIDDTPEAVVISAFDPVRREVAKIVLEKLIMDGRIHPTRIEEIVEKVRRDVEQTIKEAGENAAFDAGIHNLNPELVKVLGRLKYRTSYGQNVLKHSLEVCYLSELLANEIGADAKIAKRGGLLHDIGKALDQETEGTHVTIGVQLAKKYKENEAVIHCIEAHHGNVEFKSIEAIIVQVADAISSARPGARRESIETYIKRLEQLEEIANSYQGVEKSYAIQAGREVRIIVKPEMIDDNKALFLAKDVAKKIEETMDYPGQIKVNVIRESRSVEYAK